MLYFTKTTTTPPIATIIAAITIGLLRRKVTSPEKGKIYSSFIELLKRSDNAKHKSVTHAARERE